MRAILCYIVLFINSSLLAQLGFFINGDDASFRVDSTSFLSVDGDFHNVNCNSTAYVRFNGPLYLSGSLINHDSLRFSGTTGTGNSKKARIIFRSTSFTPTNTIGAIIGGSSAPVFWEVELDKGSGQQITLLNNVRSLDTVKFASGFLYMNGYKWKLIDPVGTPMVINHPYLKNEKHSSQFLANSLNDTGMVIYKTIYTTSTNINPANIGIEISGALNTGSPLYIYRGFKPQVNAVKSGILRYYDIYSPGYSLLSNQLKIKYTYTDLAFFTPGFLNPSDITLYVSPNTDINWSHLPSVYQYSMTVVNSVTFNGEMTADLSDLSLPNTNIAGESFRVTLADKNCMNPPISGLLLDTVHICIGNTLILDAGNNSALANTSLKWEWSSTPAIYTRTLSVSPTANFQKFKLKLKDVRGCITADSIIIAPQAPYPQITYLNHLNACVGDSVIIKDTVKISSGTYSNFWQFSDADTISTLQQTFKKLFQTSGVQAYQLITTSNYGCSVSATSTNVIVYPLPLISFASNFNCNTGVMTFTNTSVSNYSTLIISGSLWNLGQGVMNTSTLFSPSMTYSSSGNYVIKLISTNSFGCQDSISSSITIYPVNQALFIKNNSCLNDTVYFSNMSACNTGSCSYQWDFGDATQSVSFSPKKVYSGIGLFNAKLKVTNTQGCPDSSSVSIFINPNPMAQIGVTSPGSCVNEFVYLSNTSSITAGGITNYLWSFNNTYTSNSTNAVISYSLAGLYSISLTAVSDSGCSHSTNLPFTIHAQPLSQYSVNSVCSGSVSQFVSTSNGLGLAHIWDFGNTVVTNSVTNPIQNYTYSAPGNYSTQLIVIDVWGCSDTSSVMANVLLTPSASLGGSISTCGNTYTLNAGNPGANFLWQPGNQTSQIITVNNSGQYHVVVTNTNGCTRVEAVQLTLNDEVKPRLGNDTTTCGYFSLNAGYPGSLYQWNTGATNQTLIATTSATYIVQVTDLNGCLGQDTIELNILNPAIIDMGSDLTICKPKNGLLVSPITNASSLLWSDGTNGPSLNISSGGIYWCDANLTNGCKKRDSLSVIFKNTPIVDLGSDRSQCAAILLDAKNYGSTYLWSTGEIEQIISVQTSSNYFVTVSNTLSGCSQKDSINIIIHPVVNVFLGNDTTICNNTEFFLSASNPGASYSWSNNETTQNITITSLGLYGVTVTDTNGCLASDYIQINLIASPIVELGSSTRYLCGNNAVTLSVTNSGGINWGSTTGLSSSSNSLNIDQEGKYWVEVKEYGCGSSDTVLFVRTDQIIQASFLASTLDTINKPVKFVNLSKPLPTSQCWDFGDGTTSIELNPIHAYVIPQNYSVTLEVTNGFCVDRITKELNALFKLTPPELMSDYFGIKILNFLVYPNPSSNYLNLLIELNTSATISLDVIDVSGRNIVNEEVEATSRLSQSINVAELTNGLYILSIKAISNKGNLIKTAKFIKTN